MPFTTEITGVYGGAQFTGSDYTNPAITQPLINFYADLFAIANRSTPAPSAAEAAALQSQLTNLINIAKNGISVQQDAGGKSLTYYMTSQMVDSLNEILSSLQAGGVSQIPNITAAQLASWQSSVQSGTAMPGLLFNQQAFNIFYYAANNFGNKKISLNTATTATEMVDALTKTGGNVPISQYVGRSFQAMTEVDYVNEGNDLINDTLTSMYEALGLTKDTIDSLAQLQNLHNQLHVVSRKDNQVYTRSDLDAAGFQAKYQRDASTFTNNLIPQLTSENSVWKVPGSTITYTVIQSLLSGTATSIQVQLALPDSSNAYYSINPLTGQIQPILDNAVVVNVLLPLPSTELVPPTSAVIAKIRDFLGYQTTSEMNFSGVPVPFITDPALRPQNNVWPLLIKKTDANQLISDLSAAKTALAARVTALSAAAGTDPTTSTYKGIINNPQSLYNLSKKVLQDLTLDGSFAKARAWVMDNYQSLNTSDATLAGAFQQNITAAVTSAQSTNDEQKERVRNNLFLFEEFYKSASSVLTMINQIITKMAQNMVR